MKKTREPIQRSASLEQDAQQPRLAMEADITKDAKTRKRTEGAATAERVISGYNSSTEVDPDPICPASFGDDSTGPPALPCSRDDALVDNGASVPKPCLSPVEMRTRTAAGGLLPAGTASTATRTIFLRPRFSWSLVGETKTYLQDINSIRLVLQQFLEGEGLRSKIEANSGVRSRRFYRSSTRLPVFGNIARVALWGAFR